jgi:hypothetical protein
MICKIKRVMDGLEQGVDIVITLILFQERLPGRHPDEYGMNISFGK